MNDFLKMDIFFVVATMSIIVIAIFLSMIMWRIFKILRNVEHVSERVSEESDKIQEDLDGLRSNIKNEGLRLKHLADFFSGMLNRGKKSPRKKE